MWETRSPAAEKVAPEKVKAAEPGKTKLPMSDNGRSLRCPEARLSAHCVTALAYSLTVRHSASPTNVRH